MASWVFNVYSTKTQPCANKVPSQTLDALNTMQTNSSDLNWCVALCSYLHVFFLYFFFQLLFSALDWLFVVHTKKQRISYGAT